MNQKRDIIRSVSYISMLFLIIVLFAMAYISKSDFSVFEGGINACDDNWELTYTTQSGQEVSDCVNLPLNLSDEVSGDGLCIKKTLPGSLGDNFYFFAEGQRQNIDIYLDGELVLSNYADEELSFGNVTPSMYVMIPLDASDAGKTLEIHYNSYYSKYRNHIRSTYIGTQSQFIGKLLDLYCADIVFGILFIVMGILCLLIYFVIFYMFKRYTDINYLGYFGLLIGFWILFYSRGRQLLFGDVFFAEKACYVLMPCFLIPVFQFLDARLNHKYSKSFNIISLLLAGNAAVDFFLDVFGVVDVTVSQVSSLIVMGIGMAYAVAIILYDYIKKKTENLLEIIIGIIIMAVIGCAKIISVFVMPNDMELNNAYLYIGGIVVMFVMAYGNIKNWINLERARSEADHANRAKSDFLANMSHEIRTPISAVLGMNEMILRETDSDYIRTYANKIKNAGNVLLSIVNDILDFSKIESGKMELNQGEYDSVPLLIDVINMMRNKAVEKGLEFVFNVDPQLPKKLYGDDMRLRQIITNILSNAVKYTRKGSVTLDVKVLKKKDDLLTLKISIIDTGVGIKPEDISKLFDSFQRLDQKKNRNIEGTGLGMSITSHFLRMMNSELQVESTYGKGSTFWFVLDQEILDQSPIEDFEKSYKAYESRKEVEHNDFIAPDARVLVVDDNEMNLEVAQGLLKETKIQVSVADRGPRALELIKNFHYDLVLLDHMMPGMDGIETLEHIREYENEKASKGVKVEFIPVVALTANAISGAREVYLSHGFQDYLVKPIVIADLQKVLKKYIPDKYIAYVNNDDKKKITEEPVAAVETKHKESEEETAERYLKEYGITVSDGLKYSGGKPSKYKLMLAAYVKFDKSRREKIKQALESKDMENYAIEVHALKSNARGIGANNLGEMAYEHEKRSKAGDYTYVVGNYDSLSDEMDLVMKGITRIMEEDALIDFGNDNKNKTDESSKPESFVKKEATVKEKTMAEADKYRNELLTDIVSLIEEYDHRRAIEKIEEWIKEENDENVRIWLVRLNTSLRDFEFEKALNDVNVLRERVSG